MTGLGAQDRRAAFCVGILACAISASGRESVSNGRKDRHKLDQFVQGSEQARIKLRFQVDRMDQYLRRSEKGSIQSV